jgi:hypothetical protein
MTEKAREILLLVGRCEPERQNEAQQTSLDRTPATEPTPGRHSA